MSFTQRTCAAFLTAFAVNGVFGVSGTNWMSIFLSFFISAMAVIAWSPWKAD